ncbi:FAD dependent oxidoreductase [Prosthecobacter fusiformis]|uniref:FAD dependent oxidoreductase n=1 Tax=Prosthecobacter fusiformis TaxID=48464 RepID=A0A4R7SQM9_9BACT|nr:FAD-dependent oxidoreductase [Prosthecobacter fusiformis]TDU81560.1 FAD dependent oxidoreductase [Prosthecobacter fusiformis]
MNMRADVIVAGGGSAGLAAALAAARKGARTVLLERQTKLGGMGTNALVHTFCGLFHPDASQPWAWLNPGIPTEIGQSMMERTSQTAPDLMGKVYVLRQHPSLYARIADEMCLAEPQLTVLSGTEWTGLKQGEAGWELDIITRGNCQELNAKALVDTTGDATGARLLNPVWCEQTEGARLYRPAYICAFHGMTGTHDDGWRLQVGALIVRAVRDGLLPVASMGAGFRDSPFPGETFLTVDLEAGQGEWDPFDPVKRARVEQEGREIAMALWSFLRSKHADFSECPPPMLPTKAGIRETARYIGDYVITGDDLATSRRFDDDIALAGWPMEKRENARGPKFRFFDEAKPAGIPARCLFRQDVPGLYFAGRCMSADHEALASLRVMGTCMATGQSAGELAAKHASQH